MKKNKKIRNLVGKYGETDDPSEKKDDAQKHVFLTSETAERLAAGWELKICEPSKFWTRKRWKKHEKKLKKEKVVLSEAAKEDSANLISSDAPPET